MHWRGTMLILVVFVLLVGGIAWFNYQKSFAPTETEEQLNNQPKVQIEPATFDFGVVKYGAVVRHNFIVKNIGGAPLEILRLATSCGCTKATMVGDVKTIAPGEQAEMEVSFDPAVHKDDSDLGEIVRIVYLKTNDPARPETELEVRAKVIKENGVAEKQTASTNQSTTKQFKIVATKWSFNPKEIQVNQGDKVSLQLVSQDVTHGFSLPEYNIKEILDPNENKTIEFVADKQGEFEFRCSVFCGAGHGTMVGKLIVK